MDAENLLQNLSSQMDYEQASDSLSPRVSEQNQRGLCVGHAILPGGKQITLLKTMLTSACERNCYYCPFRAGRDFRRATLQPIEMAAAFMAYQRAGIVQGLFLSSGMRNGGIHTEDQLVATAEILRKKYLYRGYIHLKLMPGVEKAQVEAAMQLSDRVSINLEAPNSDRLQRLAPGKVFLDELMQPMKWAAEIRKTQTHSSCWNRCWPSITTQFVVGAAGESDLELLATTDFLYSQLGLSRTYYSKFHPINDTPFEDLPAVPQERENHLYQSSFLLRDYEFDLEELPFDSKGNLPERIDPKTAWAQQNLADLPVEINHADRSTLLRIPGIGPKSATTILAARKKGRISNLEDLHNLGILTSRARPFILLDGKRPEQQLMFW